MENKVEKTSFYETIRGKLPFFFKNEEDKRLYLINVMLLSLLVVLVPITLIRLVLGFSLLEFLMQIVVVLVCAISLYFINRYSSSQIPFIAFAYVMNLVVFPAQFFVNGGRDSGILLWMFFGNIIMWLIIKGVARAVGLIANYGIVLVCLLFEYFHPEFLAGTKEVRNMEFNIYTSYFVATCVLGSLIMSIKKIYDDQTEKLIDKDKDMMDINTNLESINASLAQASDAKSNFLANMSHELRTPINTILGMDEMIIREAGNEEIVSYARNIESAGQRLLSLVNDVLDYSKLETGKLEIHPVEYDMFSMINDCFNMTYIKAKKKELKFIVENDPMLPAILYGDEVRIRQIIMNLLSNAVKYTKDGYVKINYGCNKVDAENIELVISVKDTGIGISKKKQESIFESFERADIINTRSIEGTGVGLSIIKRLVNLMEGRITLDSEENVGSEFVVIIPQRIANHSEYLGNYSEKFKGDVFEDNANSVEKAINKSVTSGFGLPRFGDESITGAERLKAPDKKKKEAPFHAPNARILVVDDVKMNLNVVRLLLKNTDIQMDLAESGKEALNYTMLKHYDLILMDHMMPEMDGVEALCAIRNQQMGLNMNTPVIVLTANAIQNVEEKYRQDGFDDYLSKPVKSDKLEQTLFKYLPAEKVEYENLLAGLEI